jgi:predicted transcriptional regulator
MEKYGLCESEFSLMDIIWDNESADAASIVRLSQQKLSWSRSTTYTLLKRLENKGFIRKEESTVIPLIKREQVQDYETDRLVERTFKGSFPSLVSAFLGKSKISKEEADKLIDIITSNIESEE